MSADSETEIRMSAQTPEPTPAGQAPAPVVTPTPTPPAGDKQPPWGDKPEDFNPEKAWELIQNLRKEHKGPDPALRTELDTLKQQQTQRDAAVAAALGIKPEEVSDTDKLAQQVGSLQQQILSSERRALAAEHKVPESLLTGTDAAAMKAQAEALVEFAQGAHVAASTAAQTPAFQANPGQGQGNAPQTPEAQAAAEYERYYPAPTPRP